MFSYVPVSICKQDNILEIELPGQSLYLFKNLSV